MKIISYKTTLVKPEVPTELEVLSCTACDHFARPVHVRTLYFFGEESPGANKDAPRILKNALSKLLVTFYPNAGRLRYKVDGSQHLEIVCNDGGVLFIEASVDISIDDFGGFQPNPFFDKLSPKADDSMSMEEQPVQILQVTTFKCGGFSLGMALHHRVADGISAQHFISSWTQVSRGLPITVKPVFLDRSLLNAAGASAPSTPPDRSGVMLRPKVVNPAATAMPALKKRLFTFTPDQVKKIKDEANNTRENDSTNTSTFTTFESLSAYAWRSIIKARGLDSNEAVKFHTVLDARKRLKPNLPDGYYGNAVFRTCKNSTAGEVLGEPLSFAAKLVREAVEGMTNEFMRSTIAWADAQTEELTVAMNTGLTDVLSNGWFRMPFYQTDFGFGKPLFAGTADNRYGVVYMLPGHIGPGSINMFINLYEEHMKNLKVDPNFVGHKVML